MQPTMCSSYGTGTGIKILSDNKLKIFLKGWFKPTSSQILNKRTFPHSCQQSYVFGENRNKQKLVTESAVPLTISTARKAYAEIH